MSTFNTSNVKPVFILSFLYLLLDALLGTKVFSQTGSPTESKRYSTVKDIDGNVYRTVQIGEQTWFAQNLRVTRFRDGSPINHVADSVEWFKTKDHAWRNFRNNPKLDSVFGKYYNWAVVSDQRGVCPLGWHVPTSREFDELVLFVGEYKHAGAKLKAKGFSYWMIPNSGANNETGFSALGLGGFIHPDSDVPQFGFVAEWWTSTPLNEHNINLFALTHENSAVLLSKGSKIYGYYIRCIKDK